VIGWLALVAAAAQGPAAGRAPEAIWRSSCSYCHGAPSKVGPPIPAGIDGQAVRQFVRNGANAMPPFHRSEIDDAELEALADWLKAGNAAPR